MTLNQPHDSHKIRTDLITVLKQNKEKKRKGHYADMNTSTIFLRYGIILDSQLA